MDTLMDLIDALMIVTQAAIVLRFIWCCIQERNLDNEPQMYKKQKTTLLIAFVLVICTYDIPRVIAGYFENK